MERGERKGIGGDGGKVAMKGREREGELGV